ncbi:MAG: hypothetical protein DRR15_14935 [Gammaproteobacteria bacterium]|nr:MAG: hypothetical protein DRR15_14935 [Gammaproteobacteria bacterium]
MYFGATKLSKFISVIVLISLVLFVSPAMAVMVSVVATGTVSEVIDPDGLLPFDSLVVGLTPGILTFQYDDETPVGMFSSPTVAFYNTGQFMSLMLGGETVTKELMTISIFDDWESPSTPGIYQDTWQAHASSRQVNDPMPDIIHVMGFFTAIEDSTLPIPVLDSVDLVKPEWPGGFAFGQFSYLIFSQPQGTSEVNVLARVEVNLETLSAVPIPAAAYLFGSALGLLGLMRRSQNITTF